MDADLEICLERHQRKSAIRIQRAFRAYLRRHSKVPTRMVRPHTQPPSVQPAKQCFAVLQMPLTNRLFFYTSGSLVEGGLKGGQMLEMGAAVRDL